MDLSHPQSSNLSLGFLSHASSDVHCSNRRSGTADDSVLSRFDSGNRESSEPTTPIPLQLMEEQSDNHREDEVEDGEDDEKIQEFRILGHSMCFKRKRESDSASSTNSSAWKCGMLSDDLESRRTAVRVWGNQCLRAADPDVFELIEKEKHRQYRGIELIASENLVCKAVMDALGSHLTNKYSEGMLFGGLAIYFGSDIQFKQLQKRPDRIVQGSHRQHRLHHPCFLAASCFLKIKKKRKQGW